ncbi:MAG: hypothetical protein ACSHYA_15350 [Opitutaceae bacterium]
MESLLPIALFLNFAFIGGCGFLFMAWTKRGAMIAELKARLEQAGGSVASSRREATERSEEKRRAAEKLRDSNLELKKANAELLKLRSDLEEAELRLGQTNSEEAAEQEKRLQELLVEVETAKSSADRFNGLFREAEVKLLAVERELAKLRTDTTHSQKRIETAESAARDKQIQFERIEATLVTRDAELLKKQHENAAFDNELKERKTELAALITERDRLQSVENSLKNRVEELDASVRSAERERLSLSDEYAACELKLRDMTDAFNRLKESSDADSVAGSAEVQRRKELESQVADLEGKLERKEAAFVELEAAYSDASGEKPYEAHRHMEWTLNHYADKNITFKFTNEGAKAYLVGVETSVPELRYELETGHDLPRDFEARIKLAIRKAEEKNLGALPDEFDMTVLYALHVFPIRFKIRPRDGQKIERIH